MGERDWRVGGLSVAGSSVVSMELQAGGYGDQLVAVLSAATDLLADLPARVSRLTGPDLDVVLPVIDRLAPWPGRAGTR